MTVRRRTESRTLTRPLDTLTRVPLHVSVVRHTVPRTVAVALRPRVRNFPWRSLPQSVLVRLRFFFAAARASEQLRLLRSSSVVIPRRLRDRDWRTLKKPPQNRPRWVLSPGSAVVIATRPWRVSKVAPTGTLPVPRRT